SLLALRSSTPPVCLFLGECQEENTRYWGSRRSASIFWWSLALGRGGLVRPIRKDSGARERDLPRPETGSSGRSGRTPVLGSETCPGRRRAGPADPRGVRCPGAQPPQVRTRL